jgi:NAD(P)-dependent dehydrogenase (short-subunit alcohol dehydrogenase family)
MPKHSFAPDKDIPSLEGKVVLVTGANAGIGKATIHAIALHNPACIYLCARRRSAAESAASELKAQTKYGKIHVLDLDLASLNSVKNCAAEFNAKETRLDLLFLNAGVASTAPALTKEGYEYQFGINHLGHAFLTQLLLPKMMETKRADPKADVRIVVTSSNAAFAPMLPKGGLVLEAMRQPDAFSPIGLYAHSKLCNVLFTRKLAQRYPDITITAAHPGVVKSTIWGKGAGGLFSVLYTPIRLATWVSIDEGAKSQLWCGTAPLGGPNGVKSGCYYTPVGQLKEIDKGAAADQKLVDRLWEWTNDKIAIFNKEGQPTA